MAGGRWCYFGSGVAGNVLSGTKIKPTHASHLTTNRCPGAIGLVATGGAPATGGIVGSNGYTGNVEMWPPDGSPCDGYIGGVGSAFPGANGESSDHDNITSLDGIGLPLSVDGFRIDKRTRGT
jgi:hypothetical protein